ncbi:MAG: PD-(D/E)XK nuclease family protein [Armatimonadetes bacterium]|nr:PD-(D/E)XK nuclease family protein [Anaerolineae bacterium]
MSAIDPHFQFSQSSLQDYADCARRFELRYLMALRYPAAEAEPIAEHERQMQMGAVFHRMVQQHLLGIPAERLSIGIDDTLLAQWWQHYLTYGLADLPANRSPEVTLWTTIAGYRVIAKYDLIAAMPGERIVIVDWKTAQQRPKRATLAQRWQTLVYRCVLVEAGAQLNGGLAVQPEQIEMRYWFAEYPQQPEVFSYSTAEYRHDRVQLEACIREIAVRTQFELTSDVSRCRFCTYRSLCQRGVVAGDLAQQVADGDDSPVTIVFDFDQIAEIEF